MLPVTKIPAWFFFTILFYFLGLPPLYAADIESQIEARLAEFHSAYPDIEFVRTYQGAPLTLEKLAQLLGPEPVNVDYEHPADAREVLMEAQFYRLGELLKLGMPSSTLFKRKNPSPQYVCVITLEPKTYESVRSISRFLYDVDESQFKKLKAKYRVPKERFVSFVMDHELFHCLYSYEKGFTYPETKSQTRSSYDQYFVEMQADLFARLRYMQRYPGDKDFLSAIRHYKVLSLVYWDLPHYTVDAFDWSLENRPGRDIRQHANYVINDLARRIKSFESYIDDLVSDYFLVKRNFEPGFQIPGDMADLEGRKLDLGVQQEMVNQLNTSFSDLFGDDRDKQD